MDFLIELVIGVSIIGVVLKLILKYGPPKRDRKYWY